MDDDLNDALAALRASFEREAAERDEVLRKSLAEAESTTEAVAAGADAVLAEFREQNEALCKGLTALIGAVAAQRAEIDDLRKSLGEPLPPRGLSALTGARPLPLLGEEVRPEAGDADLFKSLIPRALGQMAEASPERAAALAAAVSGLSVPGTDIWQRARRDPRAFAESLRLV